MKKFINLFTGIILCLITSHYTSYASSHREAPLITSDPLADNTDVYAFRSPCDTNNVVLIADYIPFELPQGGPNYYNFGEGIRYEIHVDNDPMTKGDDIVYRFTFTQTSEDPTTFFNIRLGKQNLKDVYQCEKSTDGGKTFTTIVTNGKVPPNNIGPRSIDSAVGLGTSYDALIAADVSTASSGEKIFCGPADDPFYVDLGGIFDVGNFRIKGRDGLYHYNCHSIVIEAPVSSLQKDGKTTKQATSILDPSFVIGVYASASRQHITTFDSASASETGSGPWIQVSRLGMPLDNEAIIPVGYKDKWNAAHPNNDVQFASYFENPELALYMDDSQFGGAVPGLKQLRIQTKSLGAFSFQNDSAGLYSLKGTPAVAGTALDDANFGDLLLPNNHSPRAVDLLPIFLTGVPNLPPYQLATGKPDGKPLAVGKPFINNFLPTLEDRLRLNMAVPVTARTSKDFSNEGIVQAAVLGLTDSRFNGSDTMQFIPNMDGFPNGRRLEDDVTRIELQAVSGVALAAIGLWYDDYTVGSSPTPATNDFLNVYTFTAGVSQNDTAYKACFPYVQTPWRGFTGAAYQGVLGVTFSSFTANAAEKTSVLQWKVANQINTDHYVVEASTDANNFKAIGQVKAYDKISEYQFVDQNPSLTNTNFYRIKEFDHDGKSITSAIRYVKFGSTVITISPNPASSFINVNSTMQNLQINVFDATGRRVISQRINGSLGQININALPRGVYTIIAYNNGDKVDTKKVVKQ